MKSPSLRSTSLLVALAAALVVAPACAVDAIPDGLSGAPPGDGPRVVFDVTRRPLPEIPLPNDVATFADPTSRTGKRLNVSLVAPTHLERVARRDFNGLEGWGTFAPITVAFERDAATDPRDSALDLESIRTRMVGDRYDFRDDPFYVVDLATGVPVVLDMGNGAFPTPVADPKAYWANDEHSASDTLMFETDEEGYGLSASDYSPARDRDGDGTLDHPNILASLGGTRPGTDKLLTWYERQSDTLILRPLLPLSEKHEYAVVLTDRLRAPSGKAARSPFPFVHHAEQRAGAESVARIFADGSLTRFYGDLAGTGLDHVTFVWTFTTQPTTEDLRILRDGMHGKGPFAHLAADFPPTHRLFRSVGTTTDPAEQTEATLAADPRCAPVRGLPYVVRPRDLKATLEEVVDAIIADQFDISDREVKEVLRSLDSIDHFVIGEFESPYLLGDPEREDPDERFRVDYRTGEGRVARDRVQFWISVPKETARAKQPFPTTVWSHGSTLMNAEILLRSGHFAKQGVAMMAINLPGHGLVVDDAIKRLTGTLLGKTCMAPWVQGLFASRARDLNGDGIPDSGGLLWTAHALHSRDNIRQSVLDQMQAIRVLRSFGTGAEGPDTNGDGRPDVLGDFDGDGVADVGGAKAPLYASGNSFGGVVSMILGAIEPEISATAPISGGGGVVDLATRSEFTATLVMQQVLSPLVVALPASERPATKEVRKTACADGQRSVRFVVNDLLKSREIEIACLDPGELGPGHTVVITNMTNGERSCARTGADGRFRAPIAASRFDRLDVQVYPAPDAVDRYDECHVRDGAPIGRRIRSFEVAATEPATVATVENTCAAAIDDAEIDEPRGCQQFQGRFFPVGSALVAPQEGLGLRRQTPELRSLLYLTQAAFDPGDPINFAPLYMLRPPPSPDGIAMARRPITVFNTVGDTFVPTATGNAFARAAGALPFLPPEAAASLPEYAEYATPRELYDTWKQQTPDEILRDNFVHEGLARMMRTRAAAACVANYEPSAACTRAPKPACDRALFDADWLAEGADLWQQPHPAAPLRLARSVELRSQGPGGLDAAWQPRILGRPFAPSDSGAWSPSAPLMGLVNAYIDPKGVHVWANVNPCEAFQHEMYFDHLLVRYLESGGRDLYFLSKPKSHRCLADESCDFLR